MKNLQKIAAVITLMAFAACGTGSKDLGLMSAGGNYEMAVEDVMMDDKSVERAPDNVEVVTERKIIKEGEISFETFNAKKTREQILEAGKKYKGYISEDRIYDYGKSNSGNYQITVRVPASNFEALLEEISSKADKIDSKNIRARDVTEEFVDIQARVKTKKELETRYKELLKRANTVDEILKIEREIGNLRSEIESIEGRLKYLTDQVAFSALSISFYEKSTVVEKFGFASKFGKAVVNGWHYIQWFFIAVTNMWAFIILGIGVVYLVRRLRKRRKSRRA